MAKNRDTFMSSIVPVSAVFTRHERLTRKNDFTRVYEQGKKSVSFSFILYTYIQSERLYRRLGITASRKVGNAVVRNRCKRVVREVFRRNKELFPQGADIVVVVRQNMVKKQYSEVLEELCSIFQQ